MDNEKRLDYSMESRIRHGDRLTGKIGGDTNEHTDKYLNACNVHEFSTSHKIRFFHNIFEGDAKTFYTNKSMMYLHIFDDPKKIMHYDLNNTKR